MKYLYIFLLYLLITFLTFLLPVSDSSYNNFIWRFLLGNVYSIPVILLILLYIKFNKNRIKNRNINNNE